MGKLTKEQRSYNMSRIKGKNTRLELKVFGVLKERGLKFKKHYKIVGKPDIAFPGKKIAVFIDSDFWHGWQFGRWKNKLSPFWRQKIGLNKIRDRKNNRKLRAGGWTVIRIWEHQLSSNLNKNIDRIIDDQAEKK